MVTLNDFINRKVLQIYLDDFKLNTETIEENEEEGLKLFEAMKQASSSRLLRLLQVYSTIFIPATIMIRMIIFLLINFY